MQCYKVKVTMQFTMYMLVAGYCRKMTNGNDKTSVAGLH